MENLIISVTIVDKLRDLGHTSLFWFLNGQNPERIQHGIIREKLDFGSTYVETLASDSAKKYNEDAPLVLDFGKGRTLFAVLDGASSQKEIASLKQYEASGAFYVSHLVAYGFQESRNYRDLCEKDSLSARDIMMSMNSWIASEAQKVEGIDYNNVLTIPGMAAVLLLVDSKNKRLSLAQVADSMAASSLSNGKVNVLTPNLNEKFDIETMENAQRVADEFKCSLAQARKIPEAEKRIKDQLADSFRRKINKKGGCGILNGMPELFENKLVYSYDMEITPELSAIYLFSDGATLPYARKGVSYEKSTQELVNSFYEKREQTILEKGASILNADPEFDAIPRLKHRDDATIIEVCFN